MAMPFHLASTAPSGGRADGQLIIPLPVHRDRPNSPSNSNLAAINAAAATMRMRNGRNGLLRCNGTLPDETDDEPVLTAMAALFESLHEVHLEGGSDPWKPSIKTADGFRACKQFLYALSAAADALKIRPQSREYRNQFTKNYRALFPDQKRHYRVDVLEASQEGYTMIYVNGERFDFHGSVVESGVNFKLAWITAMDKLQQLQRENLSTYLYWRSELVPILVDLDSKWADFEQEYILELIQIERKARRYVMDVIYLENQLMYLDGSVATLVAKGDASETAHLQIWQQWQSCRRDYVRKIFRLNAIANYRRRGRGDLDLSVLETAENIIKTSGNMLSRSGQNQYSSRRVLKCFPCYATAESHPGHVYEAVSSIAASCVTTFNDFRKHINELAQTPERIDPHLCNNVTLVNHLVRLEETWELAQKYLMDTQRLRNIIHIVDFILSIVRTQKAIIAILSSADVAPSSGAESTSSNCNNSMNLEAKARPTVAAGLVHPECEKKRSLGDLFPSSATSFSSTSGSFSSTSALSGCCNSSRGRDIGIERPPHHQKHAKDEEVEKDCREPVATSDVGMPHTGAFFTQKKENKADAAGAAPGGSTSRSDTLSSTTRGSIMRQRTSSSTSTDRRETLEEKLIACDVEAFLALPRFVCLYYLLDPIHRSHILRQFLPHYFAECQSFSDTCVETLEEAYSKNSHQQMSSFAPLRKSAGALVSSAEGAASTAAEIATAGCTVSAGGGSSRDSCTRTLEELQKTRTLSAAAAFGGEPAPVRAGTTARGTSASFRCSDFSTEDVEEQEAGMDVQQQLHQRNECGEEKEEDCRLLSVSASDATTRPPSRLSSHFDTAVSFAGTSTSPATSHQSFASCSAAATAAAGAAVASTADAAACSSGQPLCEVADYTQDACSRSKLLVSQEETESEGSTMCSSSLRESTDSAISSSSSSASSSAGAAAVYCSSSSSSTFANAARAIAECAAVSTQATSADAGASSIEPVALAPVAIAPAASSSASSAATGSGSHAHHQHQNGPRGYISSGGGPEDRYYYCDIFGNLATTPAQSARTCDHEWLAQQQQHSSRMVLSKVPAGLRKMVKAWMRIQSWLKTEGLQDSKEAWLCIIARLADSEDFKLLLQKWAETKLAGFRHHLEALFQSVEEISMALQRSSPQDWNEFLQAIIQGIQRDSPSRRSLL